MFVLGTAGHVDHGKSTILRLLTGMEPDRLPEEKERGLTINLNFLWSDFPEVGRVGFIDVPGHHRFLGNMISGVGEISGFLLVVACDDGWMPQTEEHLQILKSFGIRNGLCILSKTDLVTPTRVAELRKEVSERVVSSLGFTPETVLFSKQDKESITSIRLATETLLRNLPPVFNRNVSRIWVDRVFSPRGLGVIATGTLTEGILRRGDELFLWPTQSRVGSRSLQAYQDQVDQMEPVARIAIQLSQIDKKEISRGCLLSQVPVSQSNRVDAKAFFFRPIQKRNKTAKFYMGSLEEECLLIPLDKTDPGALRIQFKRKLPIRFGDSFVIRNFGEEHLLGGGWVADPLARSKTHREAVKILAAIKRDLSSFIALETQRAGNLEILDLMSRSFFSKLELTEVLSKVRLTSAAAPNPLSATERKTLELFQSEEKIWSLAEITTHGATKKTLADLVKRGDLVALKDELFLSKNYYKKLEERVVAFLKEKKEATTSELKIPLGGLSRKYAIPILEKMDNCGLTRLQNGIRRLVK